MDTKRICPGCQKPLPPDVPLGLCPECLLKAGFPTGTEPGGENTGFIPPPVEQIAKLFPQLEIIEFIGKGGMGAVYKARQPTLDRFVALKILPPKVASGPGFAERFNQEARALARLTHPNIVAIHDFGQTDGLHYLVMEFVDGANLREAERSGRLAAEQALAIVPQICEALQFAHNEGVVHRDIKPENILLDKKGRVKITDFGIAKILGVPGGKVSLTGAKDVIGTPHYMAPEQVEHPQSVDHRADIFSLGVVFYEMLTGELPLGKFAPPSRKVQVDVRLDEVVLHALEKEPERRYQHASEVKTDVETIAATAGSAGALPAKSGIKANQSFRWMLSDERTGRRRFNWAFLLFFWSQIGLWINGTILAIGLGLWLLNIHPPHGKSFASPAQYWRMLLWLAAFAVARQVSLAALNLDSKAVGWPRWFQQTKGYRPRTVIALCLILVSTAVLAAGLALLYPWINARFNVLVGINSPISLGLAKPAVWVTIFITAGWFIFRFRFLGRVADDRKTGDSIPPSQSDINGSEWRNPANWTGPKWLSVYFSKRDSRAWVPKQIPAFGWTVNLGNPRGALALFAIVAAIILALTVMLALFMPGHSSSIKGITNAPAASAETWSPALTPDEKPDLEKIHHESKDLMNRGKADQVIVEDLALRMLAAIRDKDDATLKDISVDRIKGWRDALPQFAFEMREKFQQMTGKPFDMRATESLVDGDLAAVKCTGPKELNGIYLALVFVKTGDGWRNCWLHNSPPSVPLAKHLADFKAQGSNRLKSAATPTGQIELKLKWPPVGKRMVLDLEMERNGEYLPPGQPDSRKENRSLGRNCGLTVLKATPGGGHEVELEFLSFRDRIVLGGKTLLDYDSTQKSSPEKPNSLADLYGKVVGSKVRFFLNASNEVEQMEGIDELEKRLSSGASADAVFSRIPFSADYLKQMMNGLHRALPPKAVQPGDTWSIPEEIDMGPLGTMSADCTVTFQCWEKHGKHNCARLEFHGAVKAKPGPNSNPAATSVAGLEGTVSGVSWFDPDLGMGIETVEKNDMRMTLNLPISPSGNPGTSGSTQGTIYRWSDLATIKLQR